VAAGSNFGPSRALDRHFTNICNLSIWDRRRLRKDFSTAEDTASLLARLILAHALKETGIRKGGLPLTARNQVDTDDDTDDASEGDRGVCGPKTPDRPAHVNKTTISAKKDTATQSEQQKFSNELGQIRIKGFPEGLEKSAWEAV
jgi:hypothetical protein